MPTLIDAQTGQVLAPLRWEKKAQPSLTYIGDNGGSGGNSMVASSTGEYAPPVVGAMQAGAKLKLVFPNEGVSDTIDLRQYPANAQPQGGFAGSGGDASSLNPVASQLVVKNGRLLCMVLHYRGQRDNRDDQTRDFYSFDTGYRVNTDYSEKIIIAIPDTTAGGESVDIQPILVQLQQVASTVNEANQRTQTVEKNVNSMWTDVVGRIKNVPQQTAEKIPAPTVNNLAETVWTGFPAAADHFGLPEDMQQGLWFQDAFTFTLRDFLLSEGGQEALKQAVLTALAEGKLIPSVTKNPLPLVTK